MNRVGDHYFDQAALSGHRGREQDLALFAELGIRSLRCGVLWDRYESEASLQEMDGYLDCVRALGMRPIAGLLHHGSGPPGTSFLDPEFPEKLASYAGKVAARYPWMSAYTPVNEPNTTARFSCLYGLWYPHLQSTSGYLRALICQTKAVVLSMQAIRAVRSDAELIQTEDLGRIWSTAPLASTAELMNQRRWLPFDLLCGTVDTLHPLFSYLRVNGISEHEILWFRDHPCPPQVAGINYYVTSDRFLDHRLEMYPDHCRSAEGNFADVEAVRARAEGIQGYEAILMEAASRYNVPVAITEVHLGDRVEEQIRWSQGAWQAAQQVRKAGVACEAITFWALLGSYYWDALVTRANGHYEAGAFDIRSGSPQPSALAEFIRQCASGELPPRSGSQSQPGWWHMPGRLQYDAEAEAVA
ncbi:glycoside hydrolase [Acidipila sp. EB88]|nr:glycoside hydrolase [Acidipila sp. EB88]